MFDRKNVKQTLGRKVGFGRYMMPVWAVGAAVVMVGAVAGQAVGPVLAGSTTGSVNLTVGQAVTLDTDYALGSNPVVGNTSGGDVYDAATTRNDEGTNFTVAIEMTQGARVAAEVYVQNHSGKPAAATLQLNVPAGIDVQLADVSNGTYDGSVVAEAQLNTNTWLLTVKDTAGNGSGEGNDGLQLTIEPKDDLAPGFYTITGRIIQIAG